MPATISRHRNYSASTSANLAAMLEHILGHPQWSQRSQQLAFNRAMNLYHHPNVTPTQRHNSRSVFRRLVRNYNRTWAVDPSSASFQPIPHSNSNNNSNNNTGLHSLFINTKLVKLPANKPIDPISHHTFKKGDVATRIRQNGKNTYFRTGSFNSWFGHNWKHMNANSNAKISHKKHPLTRANVTRKNVSRVKFV